MECPSCDLKMLFVNAPNKPFFIHPESDCKLSNAILCAKTISLLYEVDFYGCDFDSDDEHVVQFGDGILLS